MSSTIEQVLDVSLAKVRKLPKVKGQEKVFVKGQEKVFAKGQEIAQAAGRWFPPGTPVSSTRKLISSSSFHRLDMTLAVAEALNNKPSLAVNSCSFGSTKGCRIIAVFMNPLLRRGWGDGTTNSTQIQQLKKICLEDECVTDLSFFLFSFSLSLSLLYLILISHPK